MASKKKSKLNLSKVRGIFYLVIAMGFMFALINQFNRVVVKANNNIAVLQAEKVKVEKKAADLEEQLAQLDNEDYVTTYARENYVFKSENEVVVRISQNGDKQ